MKKIISSGVVFVALLMFVFAAHTITNSTPIIPEDINSIVTINVDNTDALVNANISTVNITIPSGFVFIENSNSTDAGTHTFSNTSNVLSWVNDGLVMNLTNNDFNFNVTVATAGTYSITVDTLNVSGLSSSNVSITINDTTFPLVSITAPVTGGNYSGSFSLTANVTDDTTSLVYFNVTNSSGGQNGTFTASNTSLSSWNATINTSTYVDGLYNITVYSNDSNNQQNNSILSYSVRIDNTNPTISSFSCSPATVNIRATTTCTCTGADGGSGVLTTGYESTPTTQLTGTFTETCTVTDRAGNTGTSTTTYTVTGGGGGGSAAVGGGSTTQTWSMTYTSTENQFLEGFTKSIKAKERIKVKIGNEEHHVGVKSVTTTSATIEIASDPITVELDIGEDARVDVNKDDIYDIYVILNNIVNNKVEITIKKISEEIPEGEEESIETTGEIVTSEEIVTEEPEKSYVWVWIVVIILILIIIGAGYKIKKK